MNGIIILMLMAFGVGHFIEEQKPQEVLLSLDNGTSIKTEVFKKGKYFCPVYCKSNHKHIAHYKNEICEMNKRCYHFTHTLISNYTSIDKIDTKEFAENHIILPGSDPNIINASVNSTSE